MIPRRFVFAALVGASSLATSAEACVASPYFHAVIHDSLPSPLPPDTYIAEVSIVDADQGELFKGGLKARVIRVIQGQSDKTEVMLKKGIWTSCSYPFGNGKQGFIVAVPIGYENGTLIVDPIEVSRKDGHRLPDGFRLSDPPTP